MENKNDIKDEFIMLRAKGNSYDTIAKKLKVSKNTLISWSKDLKMEIKNYQNFEADMTLEKYKMSKNSQLVSLDEQLEKVREEINKRDLTDIPTPKLIDIEMKILESINGNEKSHITLSNNDWGTMIDMTTTWDA